jgi:hypothetical protein
LLILINNHNVIVQKYYSIFVNNQQIHILEIITI